MIVKNQKKGTVTIFLEPGRELEMSNQEYETIERLIKNPPPVVEIKEPISNPASPARKVERI